MPPRASALEVSFALQVFLWGLLRLSSLAPCLIVDCWRHLFQNRPAMTWSKLRAPHRDDRATSYSQDGLCHASGDGMGDPTAPVRPHDNEIAGQGLGRIQN